jgi:hypothetical protein
LKVVLGVWIELLGRSLYSFPIPLKRFLPTSVISMSPKRRLTPEQEFEDYLLINQRVSYLNKLLQDRTIANTLKNAQGNNRSPVFQKLVMDPLNTKYPLPNRTEIPARRDPDLPHPGMEFWDGQWRGPESVARMKEKKRIRQKAYYENNREKVRAQHNKWREKNRAASHDV